MHFLLDVSLWVWPLINCIHLIQPILIFCEFQLIQVKTLIFKQEICDSTYSENQLVSLLNNKKQSSWREHNRLKIQSCVCAYIYKEMLTNALKALIYELFLETFYGKMIRFYTYKILIFFLCKGVLPKCSLPKDRRRGKFIHTC